MADYKKMYLTAMDAMEKAIALLEESQQKCEDIYIEILYLIFDYPHKHYTFKYFEV